MGKVTQRVEREVTIANRQGLHMRPVLRFVDLASKFACTIHIHTKISSADGKSPMEMMTLEASLGTTLKIVAEGEDSTQAVEELARLVSSGFGEELG